ncbi:hypothetical protein QTP88_001474 [Uroleucon formosanum]
MIQSLSLFDVNYPLRYASKYEGYNVNDALQYFVPGHIHSNGNEKKQKKNDVITYLTFSSDGQELLVNYDCESVYLYNLLNQTDIAFFNIPKVMKMSGENREDFSTDLTDNQVPVPHLTQPDSVVQLNLKANYLFAKEDYTAAIIIYNDAINIHKCSELFLNRATAYINRKWNGDFYAALKDCVTVLKLEPNHIKAHIQLAVCLFEMDKVNESKMYLDQLTMKYPSYKTYATYKCLYSDLLNAQSKNKDAFCGKKLQTLDVLEMLHTEQSKKYYWGEECKLDMTLLTSPLNVDQYGFDLLPDALNSLKHTLLF